MAFSLIQNQRKFIYLAGAQCLCLIAGLWAQAQFGQVVQEWNSLQATSEGEQAARTSSLWASSGLVPIFTFLWTAGLQGSVAWLIMTRLDAKHEEDRSKSREENLLKSREIIHTRNAIIFGLARLADYRDSDTGLHLERIAMYATCLASALRRDQRYRAVVTQDFVNMIGTSSALHDIGKVGIRDSILLKPGKLTPEERHTIQHHTLLGGKCIEQIERRLGNSNFLHMAREIALYHHEHWNGSGYPHGLRGEDIPLAARIVAIVDVYDALSVQRVYKKAYPHHVCVKTIHELAGKQFDPHLVEIFLTIADRFREISEQFQQQVLLSSAQKPEVDSMTPEQEQLLVATVNGVVPCQAPVGSSSAEEH